VNFLTSLEPGLTAKSDQPPVNGAVSLSQLIEQACTTVVNRAMQASHITPRRLFTTAETARYLMLPEPEIEKLMTKKELPVVRIGRRSMLDVHDIDAWIASHKERAA